MVTVGLAFLHCSSHILIFFRSSIGPCKRSKTLLESSRASGEPALFTIDSGQSLVSLSKIFFSSVAYFTSRSPKAQCITFNRFRILLALKDRLWFKSLLITLSGMDSTTFCQGWSVISYAHRYFRPQPIKSKGGLPLLFHLARCPSTRRFPDANTAVLRIFSWNIRSPPHHLYQFVCHLTSCRNLLLPYLSPILKPWRHI